MEFEVDKELINEWIENFKSSGVSVEEELKDIYGAISNERIWQKGEDSQDGIDMREENIINLTAYKEWLEEHL